MKHHWQALEFEFSDFHEWTTTAETIAKFRKKGSSIPSDTPKKTFYT